MGKSIPAIIIGFLEAMFIVTMAVFWFEVPLQGSLWLLILGILVFLLSSVGVGLMISSFSVTQQQALLGAFLFMVPAVMLSGFATPDFQHAGTDSGHYPHQPTALLHQHHTWCVSGTGDLTNVNR